MDAAGTLSGDAVALEQTAAVSGTVDPLGLVTGTATILGLGACGLEGSIAEGSLVGNGTFSCPSGPCTGTWIVVGM